MCGGCQIKVELSFTLPEDELEYEACINAQKVYLALDDIDNLLRTISKYSDKEFIGVRAIREFINRAVLDRKAGHQIEVLPEAFYNDDGSPKPDLD